MREILEAIFGPADALLAAVPLAAAKGIFITFLTLAAAAAFLLPKEYVLLGSPDRRWFRDLRWWALAVVLPYILVYAWL